MDIQKLRENKQVIAKVEEFLKTAYDANQDFNDNLDDVAELSITGLGFEPNYRPSEVLFWVDRKAYLIALEEWDGERLHEQHEVAMEYVKSTDQVPVFQDLVDAIRNGRIAPFVGAGLSKPCGYPMWSEALRKIAQRLEGRGLRDIEPILSAHNYLGAAQVLLDVAGDQVKNFIKTEFRQRTGGIVGPVLLLPELSRGCIVTTNFDTVIEDIFLKEKQPLVGYMYGTQSGNAFVQRLLKGERCILKLHGDAQQEGSHVFTQAQYDQAYGSPLSYTNQLPKALRQIFVTHPLLFLGCSLEQDKTLDLFKSVVDQSDFEIPEHFAFMNAPDTIEEKARKEDRLLGLKIRPIWYDAPKGADGIPDHSLLEQLLRLAIAVSKNQVALS